jgi:hypothetical protein
MKHSFARLAVAALLSTAGAAAQADYVDVDLTGWQSFGALFNPNNSSTFVMLGAGAQVTGFEYLGLSFTAVSPSWRSEFTLTVNYDPPNENISAFMDHSPSTLDSAGVFGPANGAWGSGGGFNDGGPFTVGPNGKVWVVVWETFDDGGPGGLDATVNAGMLRIHYTPAIPEPGSMALLAMGLGAVGLAVRRRRQMV